MGRDSCIGLIVGFKRDENNPDIKQFLSTVPKNYFVVDHAGPEKYYGEKGETYLRLDDSLFTKEVQEFEEWMPSLGLFPKGMVTDWSYSCGDFFMSSIQCDAGDLYHEYSVMFRMLSMIIPEDHTLRNLFAAYLNFKWQSDLYIGLHRNLGDCIKIERY